MAWWVYKCNSRNKEYQNAFGDWRDFFDDPSQDWGKSEWIPELAKLQRGDFVIAYQTNRNEIVGLAKVRQTTEKDGYVYMAPLEELGVEVRPLKADSKIAAIKAFQGGPIRTIFPITSEEAEYLLKAARDRKGTDPSGDQEETDIDDPEEGRDDFSTRIWFCNQSTQWEFEREHSVVCASSSTDRSLKYRNLVGSVRKGDLIVHYRTTKGIVAISRALEDGRGPGRLPPALRDYKTGWYAKTEYFDLDPPVLRAPVADALKGLPDGPFDKNDHIKRGGYFFRFDSTGLAAVRQAYRGSWPLPGGEGEIPPEGFREGGARTVVQTVRNRRLREEAKRRYGLSCHCCGFEFESFYGELAHDRAIVHHLETFSGTNGSQRVSTVEDVRVVCANCHYVIHFSKEPMDVEVLKSLIETSWNRWTEQGVARKTPSLDSKRSR